MITFFGLPERTAGIVRGKQLAEVIPGAEFFHSQSLKSAKNKFCIFIRNHFEKSVKHYKSKGHIVGYDILDIAAGDAYKGDKNPSILKHCHDIYDFYIVNNKTSYDELSTITKKPIFIIPHHTTNNDRKKICISDTVKTVGYVGLQQQLSNAEDIEIFLRSKNIELLVVHPNSRKECDEIFQKIDIGVVFLDKTDVGYEVLNAVKKYKPNVKMSNFQSYGIPVVSVKYDSYVEFGKNVFLEAENFDQLKLNLTNLIENKSLRENLSNEGYKIGSSFHINDVSSLYKNIVGIKNEK